MVYLLLFLFRRSLTETHVGAGLERRQVEAVWKGLRDGFAVGGGPVVFNVSSFVEDAS